MRKIMENLSNLPWETPCPLGRFIACCYLCTAPVTVVILCHVLCLPVVQLIAWLLRLFVKLRACGIQFAPFSILVGNYCMWGICSQWNRQGTSSSLARARVNSVETIQYGTWHQISFIYWLLYIYFFIHTLLQRYSSSSSSSWKWVVDSSLHAYRLHTLQRCQVRRRPPRLKNGKDDESRKRMTIWNLPI